jgi:hypothetical protein
MEQSKENDQLFLELGSFIKIIAPSNPDLNEKSFYIQYLDSNEVDLLDVDTLSKKTLTLSDGNLDDKSIEEFEILSRPEAEGYARQNDLLPGKWISIQLGGEVPTIINGQISSLEEDMIEVSTWPDNQKIYIDFAYQGIPKDLPIESIKNFTPPVDEEKPETSPQLPSELDVSPEQKMEADDDLLLIEPTEVDFTIPNVKAQRKEVLLDADEIQFGEKLDEITQFVPVSEEERRFGLETQTNDLLNDLLSTIPTSERTKDVLKNIHVMIERFQQLRKEFSKLSRNGEFEIPDKKTANHKPLINHLINLNKKLYWLLPITRDRKKFYDITVDEEDEAGDASKTSLYDAQSDIYEIVQQYKTNNVPDGENKYKFLVKGLNNYLTPFSSPESKTNVIYEDNVNAAFDSIISNLEELYSSVFCEQQFRKNKFVITRYNRGLTIPEVKNLNAKKKQHYLANLTRSDKMFILGYLQMPEVFMRYNQIALPKTKLYHRAELNEVPFNYFSFLNEKKPMNLNVNSLTLEDSKEDEKTKLLKGFQVFLYDQIDDIDHSSEDHFKKFLEKMVPKTRTVINAMKKYIPNGVSYFNILYYLQPFLVYSDDITFKQYEEMVNFMRANILEFKKIIQQNKGQYRSYIDHNYNVDTGEKLSYLYNILSGSQEEVEKLYRLGYEVENEPEQKLIRTIFNTSEFIKRILEVDNGDLFMSSIAFEDIELFLPTDIDTAINEKLESIGEEKKSIDNTECKNFVLAKKYIDIEELKEDDGNPEVYFDSKYDETRYDIVEEFSSEQASMTPTNFNDFLVQHLMTNVGLSEINAIREADSMINKRRKVMEGDYAFFTSEAGENKYYYRDNNNTWIHNKELDGEDITGNTFCNLKQNCMDIKNDCGTMEINKKKIKEQLINDMLKQFDNSIQLDTADLKKLFVENKAYFASIINELMAIQYLEKTKYDRLKFDIALSLKDREVIVSPFAELRDRILAQPDFVKKQQDIIKFIDKNCRTANVIAEEDSYWFYCIKTATKLLPTFYQTLANAYFAGEYLQSLERVSAARGTKSDDGDKIVDKHSGYIIRMIEFDDAEGYDEAGYRIISRALMEEDIGDIITEMNFSDTDKETRDIRSKDGLMIKNVILTLQQQLSVSIGNSIEFVIKEVESTLDIFLPSKAEYEKQVEQARRKRKRMANFTDLHDEALIMLTLAYFLVTVQTMIPSVKTEKTFRGCGPKSFVGYPLEGPGDFSALKYIACSALKLRSRTRPWNVLPRITRSEAITILKAFMGKLKTVIDKQVLTNHLIQEKITQKLDFLSQGDDQLDRVVEFNARNWLTFLPPLINVNIEGIQELGATFRENLINAIRNGSPEQFKLTNILNGRMTLFSMKVQQEIQKVIGAQSIILSNIENDFLVENSCCNDGEKITYKYLQDKNPSIKSTNDRVNNYYEIHNYVESLQIPFYLFDEKDTKLKYPSAPQKFSEETIYKAFIRFCYFNSGIMLNDELGLICGKNASAFKSTDDIEDKIAVLKKEGKNYDEASFLKLMDIVNRANEVTVNFRSDIFSPRIIFERYLKNEEIKDDVDGTDLELFMELTTNLIDRYDVLDEESKEQKSEMNAVSALTTFLDSRTNELMDKIIEFTDLADVDNGRLLEFFNTIDSWKLRGENIFMSKEDETAYTIYTYMNTYIENFLRVYPTIIENKVDMKNPSMPLHWMKGAQKLSDTHAKALKNILADEHRELYEFYGNKRVDKIVEAVNNSDTATVLVMLSKLLPFYSDIRLTSGEKRQKTILNGDMIKRISKFLLVESIHLYIEMVENLDFTEEIKVSVGDVGEQLEEDLLRGREMQVRYQISNLIIAYLRILHNQKKVLNVSNYDINQKVLKSKEKEKAKITKNLGDLSVEERKVQDLMKNHRIGEWSLGQTRALYIYDENQFEKERNELQADALREIEMGGIDGVTERNAQILGLDLDREKAIQSRINRELNAAIMANGDDNDFGERDGEDVDYMDAIRND